MPQGRAKTRTASSAFAGLALMLSACSSGESTSAEPAPVVPSVAGVQPRTEAPSQAATDGTASTATDTPVATATPTPTPVPQSKFEADPAVKAMRAWTAEVGRTVNAGRSDSPALDRLMTSDFKKGIDTVLHGEIGLHYPGPLPIQPLKVTVLSPSQRVISGCSILRGFSIDPKTGEPQKPLKVEPVALPMVLLKGRWLVDSLTDPKGVTCAGVKVAAPKW